jgi:Pyridoxamine 5'-phosphate oxidase
MRVIAAMGEPPATRAAIEQFLIAPRLLHLGVTEPDGTPLVHPVWYTWERDEFLVHLGTPSRKRRAIDRQPVAYCTIAVPDGTVGVRGKATARLDPDRDRLRSVLQAQCTRYARPPDSETYRLVFGLLETGNLVLAVLTPHYLATWGL